ncbi:cytochrome P450 [Mycena sanguinolenta]|nr:cytochrome P450 [Mycena sanguinolenta]
MSLALHFFVAFTAAALIVAVSHRRRRATLMPPGPPGDPFIGHLIRLPSTDSALVFHQWAKTYGPIMHLKVFGRSLIILDSYQAAVDLLDKRGLIYSDRPKFTLYELFGWIPALTFSQYRTKTHTIQRQMHQSYLSRHKIADFKPMQAQAARSLVQNLFDSSSAHYEKFMDRFATSIIAQIVAGHRISSDDDPYVQISNGIYETFAKTGPPGSSPLDFFPLLQHFPPWFPGADHMRFVRAGRLATRELYEFPLRTVKEQQASALSLDSAPPRSTLCAQTVGEALPCFIREQLEQTKETEDEEQVKGVAATMFAAGELTTWTTLTVFILAMVLHPECQSRAQQEIDLVVGDMRLPEFSDREDLPFVEGILQETLRWIPALPLGVPHCAREDDIYCGMLIPKGSLVFANIRQGSLHHHFLSTLSHFTRAMGLDESVYSDPTSFRPERYLPQPAGAGEPHFSNVTFGFGRRICTGQYLADQSLWIAIASILATCTITDAVDENGNIIVPRTTMTDGLVRRVFDLSSHPNDFRCVVSPRSPEAQALIHLFNSS